jgi:hypothetical protein
MSAVVEKHIAIDEGRARLLEHLAESHGVTQDALIQEGIDLLSRIDSLDEGSKANLEAFLSLYADLAELPPYRTGRPLDIAEIREVVGTPPPGSTIISAR